MERQPQTERILRSDFQGGCAAASRGSCGCVVWRCNANADAGVTGTVDKWVDTDANSEADDELWIDRVIDLRTLRVTQHPSRPYVHGQSPRRLVFSPAPRGI